MEACKAERKACVSRGWVRTGGARQAIKGSVLVQSAHLSRRRRPDQEEEEEEEEKACTTVCWPDCWLPLPPPQRPQVEAQ